ncbi:hypothetical protein V8C86DRAFT_3116699 [Haematococcus lacustris]
MPQLPVQGPWQVVLAMVGKFGCSGAWALGLTYAGELFPTGCRSAAVGVVAQAALVWPAAACRLAACLVLAGGAGGRRDLGGIVAPQLVLLGRHLGWSRLPFLAMGLAALLAAGLVALLPETQGWPQPDTIQDLLKALKGERTRLTDEADSECRQLLLASRQCSSNSQAA